MKKLLIIIIISVQVLLAQIVNITYNYDNISRLTAVSYTTGQSVNYAYDKAGNITNITVNDGATNDRDNDTIADSVDNCPSVANENQLDSDGDGIGDVCDERNTEDDFTFEDGSIAGWDVFDNNPSGATVTNVYDNDLGSNVITLNGAGTTNGYRFRNADNSNFNAEKTIANWSHKFNENFIIYILVNTEDGARYLVYKNGEGDPTLNGTYITHYLGAGTADGTWQDFSRDLLSDLNAVEPSNRLLNIKSILVRGSGSLDNIYFTGDMSATN